jgi:Flp pilus assembly protein TadG
MSIFHLQLDNQKQQGTILILTALGAFMLASFAALALDSSLLFVARNELQNAADAGALAGTRELYTDDGAAVNPNANQVAFDTATSNTSQTTPVEVNWPAGTNNGDIQRGHWSFATRQFTPNDSLAPVNLFNATTAELDADPDFINAVRVTTRRQATPVQALFARFFGITDSTVTATAVAYIGFAGTLQPTEADQPIAICEDRLRNEAGEYSCNVGTFIPSADTQTMSETGGWTSFSQEDACSGGTNTNELRPLVCSTGNGDSLQLGGDMATLGGQSQATFKDLYDCWEAATNKTAPWNLTLPVIECPDQNVGPCNELRGAVNLNVIYVLDQANDIDSQAPTQMACPQYLIDGGGCAGGSWSNASPDGITRWDNFVDYFNIDKPDGTPAYYNDHAPDSGWRQKTIYFLPDCSVHAPTGRTGGENYGVLAKTPVLVQ